MSDEHSTPIQNPKQLIIVVVLAFVIPIVVVLLLTQLVTGVEVGAAGDPKKILERIRPVGEIVLASAIDKNTATVVAPPVAVAAAAPTIAGVPDAKKTYDSACVACHGAGIAGAPTLGDKAAWIPRLKTGIDSLYTAALKGKGAMPPKGGFTTLPDAAVKAVVDLMVAAVK
ncbi:MAG: cytochrome c5 family protein [Betaproteobacteria bacterium]|nr:cytochrome c5 family protein [Betaproteobacteria bacterium]